MRHAITFLATGGYVGYVPVAPGTFGSLLGLPLLLALAHAPAALAVGLVAVGVLLAMAVCHRAGRDIADADSGRIVLDEICGMLVAGALLPSSGRSLLLIFVVFRALDILKPFPASYFDRRMKTGFGVVADDVVAGLYTNALVRALT